MLRLIKIPFSILPFYPSSTECSALKAESKPILFLCIGGFLPITLFISSADKTQRLYINKTHVSRKG